MGNKILEVKQLKTHFFTEDGFIPAVNGVDFSIEEGKTLGIVGESGCGKSVTSLSIMRLVKSPPGKIVGGEILFMGRDLLKIKALDMRKVRGNEISMIFQEPMTSLNPVYTVGNQIIEVIRNHSNLSKEDSYKRAVEILESVYIPRPQEIMKNYPFSLSGGMRQRVMIAIALACGPKLLIADEPTTALDVTIQAQILALMKDIQKKTNTAIMFITHDLGVIAEMADDVLIMYCGMVVEQASVEDIFDNARHPYTIGLHKSIPDINSKRDRLDCIPGRVPNLLKPIKGCAFRLRCSQSIPGKCDVKMPELFKVANNHLVRCWLHQ